MIIGIGNNIKNTEKKELKNYFKRKGYFVFDCDDYLNKQKVLSTYEKKKLLDKKIKELLTEKKLVIDYTNLEHYQDYLDLCDYIINITCMTSTGDIGIERCEKYIIYNSPKETFSSLDASINSSIKPEKFLSFVAALLSSSNSSALLIISIRPSPNSAAICIAWDNVLSPIDLLGWFIILLSLISSYGLFITLKYAIISLISRLS